MFPFKSGEVSFQINEGDDQEQEQEQHNIEDVNMLENNALPGLGSMNPSNNRGRGRARGRRSSSLASTSNSNTADAERMTTHRDIERQRRQRMSNLYSSLRSILPTEYTQGKRSISDHIEETVHYIKDLEKNVKELGKKRDELRQSNESSSSSRQESRSSSSNFPGTVMVSQFEGGLQIEITVASDDEFFALSIAMQIILDEGLSIVSCTSSRIHDRLINHSLICQVSNEGSIINVNQLQQRLVDLVS